MDSLKTHIVILHKVDISLTIPQVTVKKLSFPSCANRLFKMQKVKGLEPFLEPFLERLAMLLTMFTHSYRHIMPKKLSQIQMSCIPHCINKVQITRCLFIKLLSDNWVSELLEIGCIKISCISANDEVFYLFQVVIFMAKRGLSLNWHFIPTILILIN